MLAINDKQKQVLHNTIIVAAWCLVAMGGAMTVAWICRIVWPEKIISSFFDMKYNTSIGFILCSLGLSANLKEQHKNTFIAGIIVALISATSLAEYLTGADLGIDQFLMTDYHHAGTPYPGRMSPGTSLAFACAGIQLLLMALGDWRHLTLISVMELLGLSVFSLGVVGSIGHIIDSEIVYSWNTASRMAPQTAVCFIILGTGLLASVWYRQKNRVARVPLWIPGLLCLSVLLFDIDRPRGIAGGIAYVPLVFCSLWFTRAQTAFVFAAIASLMTFVAFFIKPTYDINVWIVALNRCLTVSVVWFVAILVYLRRKSEQALHQGEKRLAAIVDHAVDGLITIDERGRIEHFNPACERIFGYSASEVIGQNIKILMPAPYHDEHDHYLARYMMTGEAHIIGTSGREVRARRKDGSIFPMDLSISAFQLEDGKHFSGIVRDISLRKQAEDKNALLAAIIASSEDAIISKNMAGFITSWNIGAEKIFGYAASEAIGQKVSLVIPPERLDEEEYIMSKLQKGEPIEHYETVRMKKGGVRFQASLTVSPVRNMAGEIIGASKILRDITLQKKVESELLQYTKALEHSNKELDDFAYIASHDLKEPLRGLFNNAKFLHTDYHDKLDEEGVRRLQRMGYLTQRMEQLVNDLLYFSRLGRQELAIQPADLNAAIREIGLMMETTLKERNAEILIPRPLPTIVCDKTRVTEVFRNLITNAVKYNDKPRKTVEVGYIEDMDTPHGKEKAIFYVRDNGIGIDPEFHEEIFRIFKRLNEEDDDKKGTGVGLTFVRKIVARHSGRVWLESEPGKGTVFYFTLGQGA